MREVVREDGEKWSETKAERGKWGERKGMGKANAGWGGG